MVKRFVEYVYWLDFLCLVIFVLIIWDKDWEIFDLLVVVYDIVGYNYQLYCVEFDYECVFFCIIMQMEFYLCDVFCNWDLVNKYFYIIGDFVWMVLDYLGELSIGCVYYKGREKDGFYIGQFYFWYGVYCGDIDLIGL